MNITIDIWFCKVFYDTLKRKFKVRSFIIWLHCNSFLLSFSAYKIATPMQKSLSCLYFFQMNKLHNIGDLKLNTGTSIEPINNDNTNPKIHGSEQQTAVFL